MQRHLHPEAQQPHVPNEERGGSPRYSGALPEDPEDQEDHQAT